VPSAGSRYVPFGTGLLVTVLTATFDGVDSLKPTASALGRNINSFRKPALKIETTNPTQHPYPELDLPRDLLPQYPRTQARELKAPSTIRCSSTLKRLPVAFNGFHLGGGPLRRHSAIHRPEDRWLPRGIGGDDVGETFP